MARFEIPNSVEEIEDDNIRTAFLAIIKEINRIRELPPVTEDLKQISTILNKVTDNL